jgi:hypothetical protein
MKKLILILNILLLLPFICKAGYKGDGLGPHIATKQLNMNNFAIRTSSSIIMSGSQSGITSTNETITINGQQYLIVNSSMVLNGGFRGNLTTFNDYYEVIVSTNIGVEGRPLMNVVDTRTGATASSIDEATIVWDADGTYVMYFKDGAVQFGSASPVSSQAAFTWSSDVGVNLTGAFVLIYDSNGTGNDMGNIKLFKDGTRTANLLFIDDSYNMNNCTDFDGFDSPTLTFSHGNGADSGDHPVVIMGGADTVTDVSQLWGYNIMTATSTLDGTTDTTTTERECFFQFGRRSNIGTIEPAVGLSSGAVVMTEGLQIGTTGYSMPWITYDVDYPTQAYKWEIKSGVPTYTKMNP